MSAPLIAALVFTVAMLVTTAYFLMDARPLLILQRDTPMDSGFVRGFFNLYSRAAMWAAGAAAVSYALAGILIFSAGAAGRALLAAALRRAVIPKMDVLRSDIQASGTGAIPGFRRMQLWALLANRVQLVFIVWSLIAFPL